MAKDFSVDLRIEFVPLPPERRAAWEYAMQIISKYMDLALIEMQKEMELEACPKAMDSGAGVGVSEADCGTGTAGLPNKE